MCGFEVLLEARLGLEKLGAVGAGEATNVVVGALVHAHMTGGDERLAADGAGVRALARVGA